MSDEGVRDKKAEDKFIKEVNEEGQRIYEDYLKRLKEDEQFAKLGEQARYEHYMKLFPDFARSHPIILRYIASFGMFNQLANFMYFKRCFERPIRTNEDYCDRQAEYISWLYIYARGVKREDAESIRKAAYAGLLDEVHTYEKEVAQIREERAAAKAAADEARRKSVRQRLLNLAAARPAETAPNAPESPNSGPAKAPNAPESPNSGPAKAPNAPESPNSGPSPALDSLPNTLAPGRGTFMLSGQF